MIKVPDISYKWVENICFVTLEGDGSEVKEFTQFLIDLYEKHQNDLYKEADYRENNGNKDAN